MEPQAFLASTGDQRLSPVLELNDYPLPAYPLTAFA